MKKVLLLLTVCILGACAPAEAPAPHRVGSSFGGPVFRVPLNAIPSTNGATTIVFDSTVTPIVPMPEKFVVSARFDQTVTVLYQIQRSGSATWRTVNGGGAGDVYTAGNDFTVDYLVQGPNNRFEVVNGTPGPSTPEFNIAAIYDRGLAM